MVKTLSSFTPSINKNAPNPQQSRMISLFMHADTRSRAIAHLIPINTFLSKLYIYIELYVYIYDWRIKLLTTCNGHGQSGCPLLVVKVCTSMLCAKVVPYLSVVNVFAQI